MFKMFNIFKKCTHKNTRTVTNIYGDTINAFNARSIRVCKDCGKIIYSNYLDKECHKVNNFSTKKFKGECYDTL